jgi:hypothetical protein
MRAPSDHCYTATQQTDPQQPMELLPPGTRICFTIATLIENPSLPHCNGTVLSFFNLFNEGFRVTQLKVAWDDPTIEISEYHDYELSDLEIVDTARGAIKKYAQKIDW